MEANQKMIPVACIDRIVRSYESSSNVDNPVLQAFIRDLRTVIRTNERAGEERVDDCDNIVTVITNIDDDDNFAKTPVENFLEIEWAKGNTTFHTDTIKEALSNHEILIEIFNGLNLQELIKFRSACSQWNEASSFVIRKKNLWTLNLNKTLKTDTENADNKNALQCIESSFVTPFPCTAVKLDLSFELMDYEPAPLRYETSELRLHILHAEANGGTEKEPLMGPLSQKDTEHLHMFQYLKLHGCQIKVFRFHCIGFIRVETVCNLFLKQMPNLERLIFIGAHFMDVHRYEMSVESVNLIKSKIEKFSVQSQSPLVLNSLKCFEYLEPTMTITRNQPVPYVTLRFQCSPFISDVLENILQAAPHLEQLKRVPMHVMDAIVKTGKIELVQEVYINFYSCFEYPNNPIHFIEHLSRFAHGNPQLKSLFLLLPEYRDMGAAVHDAIIKIVQSSQHSLTKLVFPVCYPLLIIKIGHRPRLVLPNIIYASIERCSRRSDGSSFCKGGGACSRDMFPMDFTLDDLLPFPNVQHLRLDISFKRLVTLCKNSEEDQEDLSLSGGTIRPFPSLKVLELSLLEELTAQTKHYLSKLFPNLSRVILRDVRGSHTHDKWRPQKIVFDGTTELLPRSVKSIQLPEIGLQLTKTKECQNHVYWTCSGKCTYSDVFQHPVI